MRTIATAGFSGVYVVDDDQAMLDSLVFLFREAGLSCMPFNDPQEFLNFSHASTSGCLLLDLAMPSMDGVELLRQLRLKNFYSPVIFLTGWGSVATAVEAMQLGAMEFLEKPINHKRLLQVVQQSLQAESDRLDEMQTQIHVEAKLLSLTARQRQVVELINEGLPSKQIASRMDISIKTVEVHRSQIAKKLGVGSLAELIQMLTEYKMTVKASRTT